MKLKQKPAYLLAKVGALLGFVAVLWGHNFDMALDIDKVAAGSALGCLGSMFENNATLNMVLGIVCRLFGITYTPPVDDAPTDTPPPSNPPKV